MGDKHGKRAKHKHGSKHDQPPTNQGGEPRMVAEDEPYPDNEKRHAEEKDYREEQLGVLRDQVSAAKTLNVVSRIGGAIAFLALIALSYNACLVHRQWKAMMDANTINKTAFDRAYRPYIGVDQVGAKYGYEGTSTGPTNNVPDKKTNLINVGAEIKNFGPVPGLNYIGGWHVFVGGEEVPGTKVPDSPFTFFPGEVKYLTGLIGPKDTPSIISEQKTLIVEITIEYDGPTGHYKECTKYQLAPKTNGAFLALGACSAN